MAAKSYERRVINHGDERYIYEIYGKAMLNLLKEDKQLSYIQRKNNILGEDKT
jgi:hypothetical protein